MYLIQNINQNASQAMTLTLADGSALYLQLYFSLTQQSWIFTEISYKGFLLTNFRIVNSPNMLQQYRNQLPFGIACYSANNREPSLIQDFASGASVLYVMTAADVAWYNAYLTGAASA